MIELNKIKKNTLLSSTKIKLNPKTDSHKRKGVVPKKEEKLGMKILRIIIQQYLQ